MPPQLMTTLLSASIAGCRSGHVRCLNPLVPLTLQILQIIIGDFLFASHFLSCLSIYQFLSRCFYYTKHLELGAGEFRNNNGRLIIILLF